jgi:aminocarboxymuconate-semialdehyde decarboxylase
MVVDVHAHLYPRAFMEAAAAGGGPYGVSLTADTPPFLCFEGIRFWRYTAAFHDVDGRLREMDAAGVERQVLSLGPPMTYWADGALSARLCRIVNDEIAAVVRRHADRFVGLAALPLQDTGLALAELKRAVGDLGLTGIGIGSNVQGVQLDDARLRPVFETADEQALPVFIHPINPAGHGNLHDYRLDLAVGFPYDTTIAAARLIYSGVVERCERLRICLAHLGGTLPYLRERIALGFRVGREHFGAAYGLTGSPEASMERLYFDTISYYEPALLAGLACVGAERLVIGSDAPFAVGDLARSVREIRAFAFVPERDRQKILGDNALRFLGLAT